MLINEIIQLTLYFITLIFFMVTTLALLVKMFCLKSLTEQKKMFSCINQLKGDSEKLQLVSSKKASSEVSYVALYTCDQFQRGIKEIFLSGRFMKNV